MTDEDRDNDESQAWIPTPPDEESDQVTPKYRDDDYEDPNPRATPRIVAPLDRRPQPVAEASEHVSEALKRVGMGGVLAELLEQASREVKVETQTECHECKHQLAPNYRKCPRCEGNRNRNRGDRVAELVRELKSIAQSGDPSPQREREILTQLREYDHPDIDGLVRWCTGVRDKAERGGAKATKTKTFAERGGGRW
jgi:hypothetical protein